MHNSDYAIGRCNKRWPDNYIAKWSNRDEEAEIWLGRIGLTWLIFIQFNLIQFEIIAAFKWCSIE